MRKFKFSNGMEVMRGRGENWRVEGGELVSISRMENWANLRHYYVYRLFSDGENPNFLGRCKRR